MRRTKEYWTLSSITCIQYRAIFLNIKWVRRWEVRWTTEFIELHLKWVKRWKKRWNTESYRVISIHIIDQYSWTLRSNVFKTFVLPIALRWSWNNHILLRIKLVLKSAKVKKFTKCTRRGNCWEQLTGFLFFVFFSLPLIIPHKKHGHTFRFFCSSWGITSQIVCHCFS